MAEAIQAGSLAPLIDLADNPPDQPLHSLTGDLQQPLVLYIARVPGSHDVFLTTMKPQQEVVTAQDVKSSLYYMHLDRPDDYELLGSLLQSEHDSDDEDRRGKPVNFPSTDDVRRKPLPSSPVFGLGDHVKTQPEVNSYSRTYSNSRPGILQVEWKPFSRDNIHRHMEASPPLPDRKLLGPRPMHQRFRSVDNHLTEDVAEKLDTGLRGSSEHPARVLPMLPPRPLSGGENNVPMTPPRPLAPSFKDTPVTNSGHSRFLHRKPIAQFASHGLNKKIGDESTAKIMQEASLSLIRRYDNEQWTVGKIFSKGTKTTQGGFGESSNEISIHIMTRGYSRFVDPVSSLTEQGATVTEMSNGTHDSHMPLTATEAQRCFQRHLQVSGYAMGRNQRYRPESTDSTSNFQGKRHNFDLRRHSQESSDSTESHRFMPELKSGYKKAYILRSPWDGMCEFTTGVAGRSLKCKHSYGSSKLRFGPGVLSAQVSELRFNLPSSKTLGSAASRSIVPGTPKEAKESPLFVHQHQRRSSSSFEVDDTQGSGYFAPKVELEERLDLSLGQEHAGGGFGGQQAKLGKLIVEKEGLQMLDLIVAANMALWWRVYERIR